MNVVLHLMQKRIQFILFDSLLPLGGASNSFLNLPKDGYRGMFNFVPPSSNDPNQSMEHHRSSIKFISASIIMHSAILSSLIFALPRFSHFIVIDQVS